MEKKYSDPILHVDQSLDSGQVITMNERCASKFSEDAQVIFNFLLERGFSCVSTSINGIRYESKNVYINISHEEWDSEVAIAFGRIDEEEEFSFTLFLRLVNPELENAMGERLAVEPSEIRAELIKLADAMKLEGESIMNGEDAVFEKMRAVRWWDFQASALKDD